jgi:hypothetical protein
MTFGLVIRNSRVPLTRVSFHMSLDWLKHAFAIEGEGPIEPTDEQRPVIEALCRQVVARALTTPALVFLESVRPLNYVSSQALVFFSPIISAIADPAACRHLAEFLERRGSIDYLCRRIETLAAERPGPPEQPDKSNPV